MAQIRIYTTPTMQFTIKDRDITDFAHVYVTVADHTQSRIITKDEDDLDIEQSGSDTVVSVKLTQAETKIFRPNTRGSVEINCTDASGNTRVATAIYDVIFADNLLKEVKP